MAQTLGTFLAAETRGRFSASHAELTELLPFAAKLTLECIGNSDALYHNIEHSMLFTLVGHDILIGRHLQRLTTASDYAHFILACLTHDIGYVRGVVQGDAAGHFVADVNGRTVQLPLGASDAALAPYHVDRSKLFVIERLDWVELLDAPRIARAIEYTRFPYAPSPSNGDDLNEEGAISKKIDDRYLILVCLFQPSIIGGIRVCAHEGVVNCLITLEYLAMDFTSGHHTRPCRLTSEILS